MHHLPRRDRGAEPLQLRKRCAAGGRAACASHGVLSGPALERHEASCIEELALLDTIPAPVGEAELAKARIKYLTVAPMFAEAIERTYQEISIAKLFN